MRRREAVSRNHTGRYPSAARSTRGTVVKFAVVFTILVAAGSASELFLLRSHRGGAYQALIADVVGGLLRACEVPAVVSDTTIRIDSASIEVAVECTGIRATAIFCAGVLAFPCAWRARGAGIATGLVGVGLLNVGRIAALALVAAYLEEWFDQVHAVLMQGFLILFVAPLWITWMLSTTRGGTRRWADKA